LFKSKYFEERNMLPEGILRDVTEEEIVTYEREGVVRLCGILPAATLELLGQGINKAFYEKWGTPGVAMFNGTEVAMQMKEAGVPVLTDARAEAIPEEKRGRFISMVGANQLISEIRKVALDPALPYIASRLFRTRKVMFYDDQTLLKEPFTKEYTAFHTDEPYYHLQGDQVCGMWVSPDIVAEDSGAMRYVRRSHRWGSFFRANIFVGQTSLGTAGTGMEDEAGQLQLPDIEGNEDKYDIVTYPSNPGDVIVHHSNLIHGAGPNYRADRTRRAVSFRYAGEDVRYRFHRSAPPQPHHKHNLQDGDPIESSQFPLVWPVKA
jgi:ectoine hydroxylase-related dioxygenase (phytanoyl-CoA dioxygenase family)